MNKLTILVVLLLVPAATGCYTLLLSVSLPEGGGRNIPGRLRTFVPIPFDEIEGIEVRRLNRARTFTLVGIGAVLSAVILDSRLGGGSQGERPSPTGGVDKDVVSLFLLLLAW